MMGKPNVSNVFGYQPTGVRGRFQIGCLEPVRPSRYKPIAGGAVSARPAACPPRQVSTSGTTVLPSVSKACGRPHD